MQSTRDESTKVPVHPNSSVPGRNHVLSHNVNTHAHSCKQIQTNGYLRPLPLFHFRTNTDTPFFLQCDPNIIPQNAIDIDVPSFCKLIMHIIQLSKVKATLRGVKRNKVVTQGLALTRDAYFSFFPFRQLKDPSTPLYFGDISEFERGRTRIRRGEGMKRGRYS